MKAARTFSKNDVVASYVKQFESLAPGSDPVWLREMRREAIYRFAELGLPSARQEDWRQTRLSSLTKEPFVVASDGVCPGEVTGKRALDPGTHREIEIVFVNGKYSPARSSFANRNGLSVRSMSDAIRSGDERVRGYLERTRGRALSPQPFHALNSAFFRDGACVFVEEGVKAGCVVYVTYLTLDDDSQPQTPAPASARFIRNLIAAGPDSAVSVIERFETRGEARRLPGFLSTVSEIFVGDRARVDHYELQGNGGSDHVGLIRAELGVKSQVSSHSVSVPGPFVRLVRKDIEVVMKGEEGECRLSGIYAGRGDGQQVFRTLIDHAKPSGKSVQLYRGILDGAAHGVFSGKVIVEPDAQNTDAKQVNQNLLLSDEATAHTTPRLEIRADDVKCSHGATVGQLDEEAVFYLRSRGVGEELAKKMLTEAFAAQVLDEFGNETARREALQLFEDWLRGKEAA